MVKKSKKQIAKYEAGLQKKASKTIMNKDLIPITQQVIDYNLIPEE
jgi:hypothetical protein